MPRPPGQSDFVVTGEPLEHEPDGSSPVALPRARLRSNEASAAATKVVLTITWIVLALLVVLCAVGPHIPSGE